MITAGVFLSEAEKFVGLSRNIGDDWVLKSVPETKDDVHYLEFRCSRSVCADTLTCDVTAGKSILIVYVYHVIYNEPYGVPQLLFTATKTDGSLISLDILHGLIPHSFLDASLSARSDDVWSTLTQIEHPYLQAPFYALHPCRTDAMLSSLQNMTSKWFVSWLSSVGPAVGLQMSPKYGMDIL